MVASWFCGRLDCMRIVLACGPESARENARERERERMKQELKVLTPES